MPSKPSKLIETFDNPAPRRDYRIHMEIPEFTCLCPMTGQPDFATLVLDYVPEKRCVELKSLKLYIWSFRNEGAYHEAVTHRILDDLVKALALAICGCPGTSTFVAAYSPLSLLNTLHAVGRPADCRNGRRLTLMPARDNP